MNKHIDLPIEEIVCEYSHCESRGSRVSCWDASRDCWIYRTNKHNEYLNSQSIKSASLEVEDGS